MISLKNLNLDIELMNNDLLLNARKFFNNEKVTITTEEKGQNTVYIVNNSGKEYKFSLYKKNDGTSSLCTNGTPDTQSMTDAFIHKISEDYSISDKKNLSFSVKNIDIDEFSFLQDFLTSEAKANLVDTKKETFYTQFKYKGINNDTLTIKRYINGNTQFQGKPIYLYVKLCDFLCDICSAQEIIKAQQEIYHVKINHDAVYNEYFSRLSKSSTFLGDTIRDIILPSFSICSIDITLTDYSMFIFPVLRGLEGYIRCIFNKYEIKNDTRKYPLGDFFAQDMKIYVLKPEFCSIIKDKSTCNSLGKLYTVYHDERNSIFHVDSGIETARIIETREEADSIFNKIIDLIESTFIDMNP